ncbi:MAG: polysaccharide biosynthesis tyrosine autokinase [Alphaproteobacteria bacterium]|nr:polysaccharide biosynthesis tyrosine autokinase [Alphaproteobacteria bacterium]
MNTDTPYNAHQPPQTRAGPGYRQGFPANDLDMDMRGLLLMFWRRRMVILACLLLGLSLMAIAMSFMKSHYTAKALILIENKTQQKGMEEFQSFMTYMRQDPSLILGEIEILRSRTIGRKFVERLNLLSDPEFNPRFKYNDELASQNREPAGQPFKKLSVYGSELENLPADLVEKEISDVVTNFLARLNVRSIPGSMAIQVEYTSTDPNKAALIANTVADVYIEQRLENKFQATKKITDWLDQRLQNLRTQVQESESAVAKYKEKHNITEGIRKSDISTEQLSALTGEMTRAKTKVAETEARLKEIQILAEQPGLIETTLETASSPLIQNLKSRQAMAESSLSELSTRYGPRHPKILKVKSELGELKSQIETEISKIAKSIENEVIFAKARVTALENGLTDYAGQQHENNEAMIELRELMRQAESTRLIYDTFLKSYKKSDDQEKLQSPEARIISYAVPPRAPSYPNKMLLFTLGAAISFFIGLILSILIEKLDNTFRNANQIEQMLGYPCHALIPMVESMPQTALMNYVIAKPASAVAEAVRTLRIATNLRSGTAATKPRCLTITSSFPNEGTTTLAIWLGRIAAKSGEKVIIIDADLRRSNIHSALKKSNDAGLVDYLTGQKTLNEIIQRDDPSGAHIIFGRAIPNSAMDLLSGDKMHKLIASLKQAYDLVIIDSPACLAVSDARVLAGMSDQLLYVVGWDSTPRDVVAGGIKQFTDMNFTNISLALTNVDVKRHVRYGYGDSVYYYGRYKEYYAD